MGIRVNAFDNGRVTTGSPAGYPGILAIRMLLLVQFVTSYVN